MSASAVLKLQKAGFTTDQVEALADFMDIQAVSKADLEAVGHRLETRIAESRAELKAESAELRAELKAENAELRAELKAESAELRSDLRRVETSLRAEMRQIEQRMTIKLGGMLVVITGILLAAIRYLPVPH